MESLHFVLEEREEERDDNCPEAISVRPRLWEAITCYMVDNIAKPSGSPADAIAVDLDEEAMANLNMPVIGTNENSKKAEANRKKMHLLHRRLQRQRNRLLDHQTKLLSSMELVRNLAA